MGNGMPSGGEVTSLLRAWSDGDPQAAERLIPMVYAELRRQAARCLRRERRDHTLRPTALVHEAYLRLLGSPEQTWQNRLHFFAVAARVMRHVLVDHARGHRAGKRGGSWCRVPLEAETVAVAGPAVDLLALEAALDELASLDADQARLVELRFFAGLDVEETALVLGVSARTVKRGWRSAKAWLYHRIQGEANPGSSPRQSRG